MSEAVVLVHGLWMTGLEMALLRRRLRRCGWPVYTFHYPTVRQGLTANAARLDRFLARLPEPRLHLVGHSMGGQVILKCLRDHPRQRPGRVVTLGTPHLGSRAALALSRWRAGRLLLGRSEQPLCHPELLGQPDREVGVISGSWPVGLGRLLAKLPRPHDGTVAVRESAWPLAADSLVLPVSHLSMLVSGAVAAQTCHFLRHGRFRRSGT